MNAIKNYCNLEKTNVLLHYSSGINLTVLNFYQGFLFKSKFSSSVLPRNEC